MADAKAKIDEDDQAEYFVCEILDPTPKGDLGSMEHPIFSLSTKKDMVSRTYENSGVKIIVTPSVLGRATVHDRDILIYCTSQLIGALNRGEKTSRNIRISGTDLMRVTKRTDSGRGYNLLRESLRRIAGTKIETNIVSGGKRIDNGFALIDEWTTVRSEKDGRMLEIEVTLSRWLYNAILSNEILTLSRDYFELRKPLERRLYEIGRKHCGQKKSWPIGLDLLQKKCGSTSSLREFRRSLQSIMDENGVAYHIPDYELRYDREKDQLRYVSKGTVQGDDGVDIPPLDPRVYEDAREAAPGWDVRTIENEWRKWATEMPQSPERAFIGFCRSWFEKRGRP